MAKIISMRCIQCENFGVVVTTKKGYRCEECGCVWQKDSKKPKRKPAPKKGG